MILPNVDQVAVRRRISRHISLGLEKPCFEQLTLWNDCLSQPHFPLGMNPGTPVSTTALNLTRALIPSLISRIALGVERVEFLVEPFLAGLPGVDRAPHRGVGRRFDGHLLPPHAAPRFPVRRKNRYPFVWVPVTFRATAVSVG